MGGGMLQNFWFGGKGSGLAKAKPPRKYNKIKEVLHNTEAETWDKEPSHGIGIGSGRIHQGISLIQPGAALSW